PLSQVDYFRMRAVFEPHYVRTDRVAGERDILKQGLPRVYDLKPGDPTFVSIRGDEARPDTKNPISPGVPQAIGGELAIEPVKLSLTAYYPGLRDGMVTEDEVAAAKLVTDREAARVKAQAAVAAAQKTLSELTPKGGDLSAAQKEVATAVEKAEVADRQL